MAVKDTGPSAETLLARTDKLFTLAYNAYAATRGLETLVEAVEYNAYAEAWSVMTGLSPSQVLVRMRETYAARQGARIES